MPQNDTRYMIIDYDDVTDDMVAAAAQDSRDTLRHTVSGTDKVILKYRGSKPTVFYGITTYSQTQILNTVTPADPAVGNDWTEPV